MKMLLKASVLLLSAMVMIDYFASACFQTFPSDSDGDTTTPFESRTTTLDGGATGPGTGVTDPGSGPGGPGSGMTTTKFFIPGSTSFTKYLSYFLNKKDRSVVRKLRCVI